jgi:hypothetical protein
MKVPGLMLQNQPESRTEYMNEQGAGASQLVPLQANDAQVGHDGTPRISIEPTGRVDSSNRPISLMTEPTIIGARALSSSCGELGLVADLSTTQEDQ